LLCERLGIWKLNLVRGNLKTPARIKSDLTGYPVLVVKVHEPFELGLFDRPHHERHALWAVEEVPNRRSNLAFKISD
jgi:hypothetical protein